MNLEIFHDSNSNMFSLLMKVSSMALLYECTVMRTDVVHIQNTQTAELTPTITFKLG